MANDKAKACKVYCDQKADGKSNQIAGEKAKAVTTIGHSILDLAWYADSRNPQFVPDLGIKPEDRQAAVIALRAGLGWKGALEGRKLSWGMLVIALGYWNPSDPKSAEGQVRTMFGSNAGIASEGTRIGRGGRWLNNEPRFYTGNHKGAGVEDAKPRALDPDEVMAGAADYKAKLPTIAKRKVTAAKRGRGKASPKAEVEVPAEA